MKDMYITAIEMAITNIAIYRKILIDRGALPDAIDTLIATKMVEEVTKTENMNNEKFNEHYAQVNKKQNAYKEELKKSL